jgi:macrolide transport system ATP-binding/permease protein
MRFLWFGRKERDQELQEEMRSHLEMAARDRVDRGEPVNEANHAARREFGNLELAKQTTRDVWGWRWLDDLFEDARYGLRALGKNPGFAFAAILTLALGIGANTAIFSIIDAALLRSLPVRDADRLVLFEWRAHQSLKFRSYSSYGDCTRTQSESSPGGCSFSQPFFNQIQSQSGIFSSVAAYAFSQSLNLTGNGPASTVDNVNYVSGNYFETLGVMPATGRLLTAGDDDPSSPPAVVLSYNFWRSEFGGTPSAIGKTIFLNKTPCTIVGVAEERFPALAPGSAVQMWVPLVVQRRLEQPWNNRDADPTNWWLVLFGKLKPGATRAQAQAAVATLFQNEISSGEKPMSKPEDQAAISITPIQDGITGDHTRLFTPMMIMMLVVGIVLLIACANVAGLLLSRAAARQQEMAVRFAIGASPGRILRQLLTESVLLSILGGALGILLASWAVVSITTFVAASGENRFSLTPAIDLRVLAFTSLISVATGILFGLAPGLRAMHVDLAPVFKGVSGGSTLGIRKGRGWFTAGNALVIAQVALGVVVLAGAGLVVRTLQNLKSLYPGFDSRNLLTFYLDPAPIGYQAGATNQLYRQLQARFSALPSVTSVSYSWQPLLGGSLWSTDFHLPGKPKDERSTANKLPVGPDFFQTMRIPLLTGRSFNSDDLARAQIAAAAFEAQLAEAAAKLKPGWKPSPKPAPVNDSPVPAIVNQSFVHAYLPKANPLGQRFGETEEDADKDTHKGPGWVIVGVVGDAKYNDLRSPIAPTIYVPSNGSGAFALRTAAEPSSVVPQIRGIVRDLDPNLPVTDIKTQEQRIDAQILGERLAARLLGFFGLLALFLACIGLYGLVSYEVARRTREIGIRAALGAEKRDVLRMVLTQGMRLAVAGAILGLALALGLLRFAKSMLFGVEASDPATFSLVTIILIAVTLLACYLPARRAMRVDPMVALRYE